MATDVTQAQLDAVLAAVERVLGANVAAVYLFGSAVAGGLRPHSDLDLLVVLYEPTTADQRARLVAELRPLSRRGERPAEWRPIELTAVVHSALDSQTISPRADYQYGEWLREELDAGQVDPAQPDNPDLIIILAQARASGRALRGPHARETIKEIPPADVRRAMLATVDSLLADLETDTTNVLLTLARIAYTLETAEFTAKDSAAGWATSRVTGGTALRRAAAIYRGSVPDEWAPAEAALAARQLMELIRG
jgi:streptomycin 3"-adenylyltransferase